MSNNSYLDLPYDLDGFINSINKFLERDTIRNSHKIDIELPIEYKKIVIQYIKLQDNPEINEKENIYNCEVRNKNFVFHISEEITELKIKVFKPKDKKFKKKKYKI